MKIKTNLRAGAKSGTVASGNKNSSSTDSTSVDVVVVPVYTATTRCAGY